MLWHTTFHTHGMFSRKFHISVYTQFFLIPDLFAPGNSESRIECAVMNSEPQTLYSVKLLTARKIQGPYFCPLDQIGQRVKWSQFSKPPRPEGNMIVARNHVYRHGRFYLSIYRWGIYTQAANDNWEKNRTKFHVFVFFLHTSLVYLSNGLFHFNQQASFLFHYLKIQIQKYPLLRYRLRSSSDKVKFMMVSH